MGCLRVFIVCLAAAGVGVVYFCNQSHVFAGTVPLMHLGREWGWSHRDVPDLAGATAVVTGASSGLGLGVATILAKKGARVVVTARSRAKCDAALAAIENAATTCKERPVCVEMELLSLRSTLRAAEEIAALAPEIDHLVLNAGIMTPPFFLSEDGLEAQFQTNHLGHFAVLKALLPRLHAASGARGRPATVVSVSSVAHHFYYGEEMTTAEALNDESAYDRLQWYAYSKLCNIWLVRELNRREATGGDAFRVTGHAVHPGGVRGKLLRYTHLPAFLVAVVDLFYWDPRDAALTVLRPLLDPAFSSVEAAGTYFSPIARPWPASAAAADHDASARLWAASDVLIADIRRASANFSDS